MKQHINNTCRAAAFGISKIGKLRKYLNKQSTERLIHAFVTSHLDYCNGLYVGLPNSTLAPLQRIQNTAARLVTKTRKHEHITPILKSFHWLPIISRIQFKILLFVFKIKHDLAPSYLNSDLLQPMIPARSLRSSRQSHLQFTPGPRTFTRYGDRAFSVAAPKLWNRLPINVRNASSVESFKASLKHFLFTSTDFHVWFGMYVMSIINKDTFILQCIWSFLQHTVSVGCICGTVLLGLGLGLSY